MTSTQPATKDHPSIVWDKVPAGVARIINMDEWAKSILTGAPYHEPDPDFISRSIAFRQITADTIEEVFAQMKIRRAQTSIPDMPGASSGPMHITDLYVAESDFETGNPTYVIMTYFDMESGEEHRMTTGATNIQATLIALLRHGQWPITCQIKRGEQKDRGGHYLLFMMPPD